MYSTPIKSKAIFYLDFLASPISLQTYESTSVTFPGYIMSKIQSVRLKGVKTDYHLLPSIAPFSNWKLYELSQINENIIYTVPSSSNSETTTEKTEAKVIR